MTLLIIIGIILSATILLICLLRLSHYLKKKYYPGNEDDYNTKPDKYVIFLVLISTILIVIAGLMPFIFTRKALTQDFDFSSSGQIGDTIGGLISPFIGLAAVLVTGLAFYMQYRANKLQVQLVKKQLDDAKSQFKEEQKNQEIQNKFQHFESQFFEMLRLHKENVSEMKTVNSITKETVVGRDVFRAIVEEINIVLSFILKFDDPIKKSEFKICYDLIWEGFSQQKIKSFPEATQDWLQGKGQLGGEPFNISYHRGYSSMLGHYFRHLFLMVKFVVYHDIFKNLDFNQSYESKMKYLKILRAQLSNYEQIFIFYNWLSGGAGSAWENKENKFFTEYKMIHNLPIKGLFPDKFIYSKINGMTNEYNKNHTSTRLFEFQESKSKMKLKINNANLLSFEN